jgi:hypothetical protein
MAEGRRIRGGAGEGPVARIGTATVIRRVISVGFTRPIGHSYRRIAERGRPPQRSALLFFVILTQLV